MPILRGDRPYSQEWTAYQTMLAIHMNKDSFAAVTALHDVYQAKGDWSTARQIGLIAKTYRQLQSLPLLTLMQELSRYQNNLEQSLVNEQSAMVQNMAKQAYRDIQALGLPINLRLSWLARGEHFFEKLSPFKKKKKLQLTQLYQTIDAYLLPVKTATLHYSPWVVQEQQSPLILQQLTAKIKDGTHYAAFLLQKKQAAQKKLTLLYEKDLTGSSVGKRWWHKLKMYFSVKSLKNAEQKCLMHYAEWQALQRQRTVRQTVWEFKHLMNKSGEDAVDREHYCYCAAKCLIVLRACSEPVPSTWLAGSDELTLVEAAYSVLRLEERSLLPSDQACQVQARQVQMDYQNSVVKQYSWLKRQTLEKAFVDKYGECYKALFSQKGTSTSVYLMALLRWKEASYRVLKSYLQPALNYAEDICDLSAHQAMVRQAAQAFLQASLREYVDKARRLQSLLHLYQCHYGVKAMAGISASCLVTMNSDQKKAWDQSVMGVECKREQLQLSLAWHGVEQGRHELIPTCQALLLPQSVVAAPWLRHHLQKSLDAYRELAIMDIKTLKWRVEKDLAALHVLLRKKCFAHYVDYLSDAQRDSLQVIEAAYPEWAALSYPLLEAQAVALQSQVKNAAKSNDEIVINERVEKSLVALCEISHRRDSYSLGAVSMASLVILMQQFKAMVIDSYHGDHAAILVHQRALAEVILISCQWIVAEKKLTDHLVLIAKGDASTAKFMKKSLQPLDENTVIEGQLVQFMQFIKDRGDPAEQKALHAILNHDKDQTQVSIEARSVMPRPLRLTTLSHCPLVIAVEGLSIALSQYNPEKNVLRFEAVEMLKLYIADWQQMALREKEMPLAFSSHFKLQRNKLQVLFKSLMSRIKVEKFHISTEYKMSFFRPHRSALYSLLEEQLSIFERVALTFIPQQSPHNVVSVEQNLSGQGQAPYYQNQARGY